MRLAKHLQALSEISRENIQTGFNRFTFGFAEPYEVIEKNGVRYVFIGDYKLLREARIAASRTGARVRGYRTGKRSRGWVAYARHPLTAPDDGLVSVRVGVQVAWFMFKTMKQAERCAEWAVVDAGLKNKAGYTFGEFSPGTIEAKREGWEVCVALGQ